MATHAEHAAIAVQKERLIKEGELYRVGVRHSKQLLADSLQPHALVHGALHQVAEMAHIRMGSLLHSGGLAAGVGGLLSFSNARRALPMLIKVGGFIVRKRLIKPVLAVTVVAVAGTTWLMRRQRQHY